MFFRGLLLLLLYNHFSSLILTFMLLPLLPVPIKKIFYFVGALFHSGIAYSYSYKQKEFHECNWVIFLYMDVSLSDVFGWGKGG